MKIFDILDRIAIAISVAALFIMMSLTCVSVIGRYIFNSPIPDDITMNEFLMVFVVFLPLAAVQAAREHVFVTIFTEWMGNKSKVVMETFGVVLGAFIFTLMTLAVYTDFLHAYKTGAYVDGLLELPESPAKFALVVGMALLTLRLYADAVVSVFGLFTGNAVATLSEEDRIVESENFVE